MSALNAAEASSLMSPMYIVTWDYVFFFFQAEDGIRDVAGLEFRRVLFRSRDATHDTTVAFRLQWRFFDFGDVPGNHGWRKQFAAADNPGACGRGPNHPASRRRR